MTDLFPFPPDEVVVRLFVGSVCSVAQLNLWSSKSTLQLEVNISSRTQCAYINSIFTCFNSRSKE